MIAHSAALATPHPQAAAAARDILHDGGNAFDAAVAAMLVNGVVQSHQVGLGGYGGNLVAYLATENKVIAIDFDSRAPIAFRMELFADESSRLNGYLPITVPAVLAGMDLALRAYGTMSWPQVTEHAIRVAEEGFPTDAGTARYLEGWEKQTDDESRRAFFPSGKTPKAGDIWIQKDLARLYRRIADEGPDVFYKGEVARSIVRHIQSHGGILSEADFAEYEARQVAPVSISYRGHEIHVPPPPGGGVTTLQILKTLEQFDIPALQPWSAEYFHLFAQAAKLCWLDRTRVLGDPDAIEIPLDQLLSDQAAREKAAQIGSATPQSSAAKLPDSPCTANVTIIDKDRNVVSMTATQGFVFGSQTVIPGLGLIMGHGMSRFDFSPDDHPNAPRPRKRMHHNMVPTIVTRRSAASGQPSASHTQHSALSTQDCFPRFAFGLPGGTKIITVTAQLAINFIDFHTTPRECILAPRMHVETSEPLGLSSKVPDNVIEQLRALGHQAVRGQTVGGPPGEIGGNANAVSLDATGEKLDAASQASEDSAMVLETPR